MQKKEPPQLRSKHISQLKGKITDRETGRGIPVRVTLYAGTYETVPLTEMLSDSTGHYTLFLPDTGLARFFKLVFSHEQYQERSLVVDKFRESSLLSVRMQPQPVVTVTTSPVLIEEESRVMGVERRDYYITSGIPVKQEVIIDRTRLWTRIRIGLRHLLRFGK